MGEAVAIVRQWEERIECPGCGNRFHALVQHYEGDPWPIYCVMCRWCSYWIMESEWDRC